VTQVRPARPGPDLDAYSGQIWKLLEMVDQEFIPALSHREGTTDQNLQGQHATQPRGPHAYFTQVMEQHALLALSADRLLGLMSFIVHHRTPLLDALAPSTYISTIAVFPSERRGGLARQLYYAVMDLPADLCSPFVVTRTWSTNDLHIPLLLEVGFKEACRLPDDRGPGIDTVYYARPASDPRPGRA
jgi:GNAT superfamily N-acetyltransferase